MDLHKYERIFTEGFNKIERLNFVCAYCSKIVKAGRNKDGTIQGKLVGPPLRIFKVTELFRNNEVKIAVHWMCPECHNVRFLDTFDNFDDIIEYLEEIKEKGLFSGKADELILELIKRENYEKLPGYTASVAGNIALRKQ